MFRLLSKSQFAGSINKVFVRNFSLVHRSELQFLNSNVTSLRPISQLQNYFTKLKLVLLEKVLRFLWYILYREKTCLSSHLITTQIINDFHIYCRDLFDKFFFFFLFDSTTSKVLLKKSYLSLLKLMSARARLFLQTCFSKVSSFHNTYLPQNFFLKNSLSLSFVDSAVNLVSNMHFSRSNNSFIINYRVYDSFFSFLRGVRSEKCAPAVQSTSSIFFIRYQRRYNKRRHSRVRSLSRSPFFAGTALSALLAAMFYGGTHKSVD